MNDQRRAKLTLTVSDVAMMASLTAVTVTAVRMMGRKSETVFRPVAMALDSLDRVDESVTRPSISGHLGRP